MPTSGSRTYCILLASLALFSILGCVAAAAAVAPTDASAAEMNDAAPLDGTSMPTQPLDLWAADKLSGLASGEAEAQENTAPRQARQIFGVYPYGGFYGGYRPYYYPYYSYYYYPRYYGYGFSPYYRYGYPSYFYG